MTGKQPRPDVLDALRPARDELERIWSQVHQSYDQRRTAAEGRDDHAYLSAQLEAAHAHMVGERVARDALCGTLGRPRGREPWRREEAEYQFDRTLSRFAYHHEAFRDDVRYVEDWIRQFGRPVAPGRELEAER